MDGAGDLQTQSSRTVSAASERGQSPLNLAEMEARARELLDAPTYAFIAEGAGDERTLARNVEAFERYSLLPRVLTDVSAVSAATEVLGEAISLPVLVAPMGMQRLADPEGECATARGAAAAGTLMCISAVASRSPAEIASAGERCWYQLYSFRDRGLTEALIDQAEDAGCSALVLTVDGPVIGRRERSRRAEFSFPPGLTVPGCGAALGMREGISPALLHDRTDPALTWAGLEALAARTRLPLILKGILSPADADLACEHGAAGVVVSNHGGRQLDRTPATMDVLEAVVETVAGRAEVLIDGGFRRGTDVLMALALGARAVLIGRPIFWGLAVAGEGGVRRVLQLLEEEIESALSLLGCRSPANLTRTHLLSAAGGQAPVGAVR